jgi:fructose-1,6-bisphosphatase/inositol monophosphatase family enzyme
MMSSFHTLLPAVDFCSDYARKAQANIVRTYKQDGSVLTSTDLFISRYLIDTIKSSFPRANIICEEELTPFSEDAPYTFVIDPIDGTDVYSQGFPSWCIAIGILDQQLQPVGGIISAPRWGIGTTDGLLIYRFPDQPLMLQGAPFTLEKDFSQLNQLVVCSNSYKHLDFSGTGGKLRSFGSNILHILSPAIHNHILAAVFSPCYIWDIAAAHAIVAAAGLEVRYASGAPVDYRTMIDRGLAAEYAYVSTPEVVRFLQKTITIA